MHFLEQSIIKNEERAKEKICKLEEEIFELKLELPNSNTEQNQTQKEKETIVSLNSQLEVEKRNNNVLGEIIALALRKVGNFSQGYLN